MNDLEILRPAAVFAYVVEAGSFRGAADQLGLSAPYVSQLVADLETRLGRQLLYRSTRKISLSSDGERFLPTAQAIAQSLRDGVGAFRDHAGQLQGKLRLNVPTVLAAPLFAKIIAEFQERHPAIALSVTLDDHMVDPLDRQADLTIRIGDPAAQTHGAVKLFETRGVVCTSHQLADDVKMVRDLADLRWIKTPDMPKRITFDRIVPKAGFAQNFAVEAQSHLVTNSAQLAKELVQKSVGWAIFPEFSIQLAVTQGYLAHVVPEWATTPVGVYCVYSARQSSLSNAQSFVQFMQARFR